MIISQSLNWVSEFSFLMHEHDVCQKPNYDFDLPCIAQWAYTEDVASESAFKIPMSKTLAPRRFLLTAQGLVAAFCVESNKWPAAQTAG